jgi:hypothetical protein
MRLDITKIPISDRIVKLSGDETCELSPWEIASGLVSYTTCLPCGILKRIRLDPHEIMEGKHAELRENLGAGRYLRLRAKAAHLISLQQRQIEREFTHGEIQVEAGVQDGVDCCAAE